MMKTDNSETVSVKPDNSRPTQFPAGSKVRDIYTGKVNTVKLSYWQYYDGGSSSDYTVEFVEGGWNKSNNLEKIGA